MDTDRLIEVGVLLAYLAVLMWIGMRSARTVKTSSDYTLAGRSVPWVIVLATTAATMIGGGASVGMVSKVASIGIAAAFVTCAWHLQLIFTGIFVAPKLRGLNVITVGDYFHLKFGPLARELAVVNSVIFLVGALAAQMAAIGHVTNSILGLDYTTALLIGAAVTVFYSTVGGIQAVVKTDVLQFVILVIGIGTAAAMLYSQHGGFDAMLAKAQAGQAELTSHQSAATLIGLFVAFLLGETFVPPYAVRCFIAKDAHDARRGVAGAGIFLLAFLPIATFTLGTAAQITPEVQDALADEKQSILKNAEQSGTTITEDQAEQDALQIAFPTLIRTTFHPVLAGVIIAAIIAAVMSSADSCLSCLSTVVMEDAYRRHINRSASDRQLLRVAQITTLLTGIASALCAWKYRNIADILVFVYDFWAPTMVLPFLVGVFWYRKNCVHAIVVSMITGIVTVVAWRLGPVVVDAVAPGWATDFNGRIARSGLQWLIDLGPAVVGTVLAAVMFLLTYPLTSRLPVSRLIGPGSPDEDHLSSPTKENSE